MVSDDRPVGDADPSVLIARYGLLHTEETDAERRPALLVDLLVDICRRAGIDARAIRGRLRSGSALAVTVEGRPFVIEVSWASEREVSGDVETMLRAVVERPHVQFVLVAVPGVSEDVVRAHHRGGAGRPIILLDRSHLEAVLYGLTTLADLLVELAHRADYDSEAWTSLTDLLVHDIATPPPQFTPADRSPAPWPLQVEAAPGVRMRHTFTGDRGWDQALGCATIDGRLLITTARGVVQTDLARGTVEWLLPLPGCRGAPLIRADGAVLTLCRDAVVAWKDGVLTPVGGGFPDGRVLLDGPGERPWVLSGYGPHDTLALTRLEGQPGQQHRRPVHFGADVRAAAWLSDLRFYLAAAGHSAVVDLAHSSGVRRDDWIVSPHDRPDHQVVLDPNTVITASPTFTGVGVSVYRTTADSRDSELLIEIASNRVDGLTGGPTGELVLLGDVRGNNVGVPHPIVVAISAAQAPHGDAESTRPARTARVPQTRADPAPATPGDHHTDQQPFDEAPAPPDPVRHVSQQVSVEARGTRRDYRLDSRPLAPAGGQGTVYGATHKSTGQRVAFKRLNNATDDQRARMQREVDAAQLFGGHPNVMPVLDFNIAEGWFVMPVASHSAQAVLADLSAAAALRDLVTAMCEALREPHQRGWIHRDLKPDNLLWLDDRWVVTDWGLGRRPRGQTTDPQRTQVGGRFGTEGFAAPELSIDAHDVGPTADIYSIGQIIGWALTGTWPRANVPLLPPQGPWRPVVKAATHNSPEQRPTTVDDLLAAIAVEFDAPPEIPANRGEQLLTALRGGDPTALQGLIQLGARHPGDYDLYLESLVKLEDGQLRDAVIAHPAAIRDIVRGVPDLHSGAGVTLEYGDVDQLVTFLLVIAHQAETIEEWDLLEDAAENIFYLDLWDRWGVQRDIRSWLASRTGHAAAVVAGVVRRNPDNHPHFSELIGDRRVDHRVRTALT